MKLTSTSKFLLGQEQKLMEKKAKADNAFKQIVT